MSNPESANAATSDQTSSTQTTSWFQSAINAITGLYTLDAEAVAQVLALWTAARAAVSTVASGVASAAANKTIMKALAKYQDVPLSAAALADMVVRNILPDSTGEATAAPAGWPDPIMSGVNGGSATDEATLTGVSGDRFHAMVADTGESYGIIDALRLYNRGGYLKNFTQAPTYNSGTPLYQSSTPLKTEYGISQTELYNVIAYSRVRNQFTNDLIKLSKETISPADAVELAVKEVVSVQDATDLYAAGGGMPEQFPLLYRGAGDAAGLEHLTELAMHNVITEGELKQGIGMSRLNPAFYYLYTKNANGVIPMAQKWLPAFELRQMVDVGLMDQADAETYMTEQGYSTADAKLFFQSSQISRIVSIRGATESQIATDWQAGLITQAQATTALKNLGYQDWAIPIILDTYEARKVIAQRNAVVTRVRSAVLVGGVDAAAAVSDLQAVGFSAPAAQEMVADWTVEANTPNKVIEYSVIGDMLKSNRLGTQDGINYFRRSGYSQVDAELLTEYYQSGVVGAPEVVTGTPGPVTRQEPTPLPPPPSRQPITELPPEVP